DDAKAMLAESSDREVALDAAAVIEHLGVGQGTDRTRHAVVCEVLEELGRAVPADLDLRERREVEDRGTLAARHVLDAERLRPQPPAPARPWAQNPAATQNPRTSLGPRMNSLSGVNASGPLTRRTTSASFSEGVRSIALVISGSKRSQSGSSRRPLKSGGMPSSPHGCGLRS